jgi:2,4-dienoyl-CoA reductase-like NADH-dependent reductase (Old Yellow Enzyme family)
LNYPLSREPIRVGRLELKNRLFVPAHTTNFGEQHLPTERHAEYHRARARGGAALVIFESIRVARESLGRPQGVAGYDRRSIPAFQRCAEAVHAEGAKLFGQVIHLGRQVEGDFERTASFGPSPLRWSPTGAMPHAMNEDDMQAVIDAHIVTAKNVLEAGMDGFELHLGHGHLLQQFLSPLSNVRADVYGGSEENRLRFPIAVLKAVRAAIGPQVAMGIRFSGSEFIEGGLELADSLSMLPRIFAAVPLDFVNVSHSAYHMSYSLATQFADMHFDAAPFRELSREIRRVLREAGHPVPVMAAGKYRTLAQAEEALAGRVADMVGFARGHIADPELVAKSFAGREDEVRVCIGCNQGCAQMLEKNLAITCMVNPAAGKEAEWPALAAARKKRKVVVIGAGPAGLEAAATAAELGHDVTLLEKAAEAGGQLLWIRNMPARRDFLGLLAQQLSRARRSRVQMRFGVEAHPSLLKAMQPDRVVLATGSIPQLYPLALGGAALTLEEAIAKPEALGRRVAFHDLTGEFASLGAIEHLADLGLSVTVFTPVAGFAWRTTIYSSLAARKRLRDKRVRIAPLRSVKGLVEGRLIVEDTSTGDMERLAFDSLVVAQYNAADDRLYGPLRSAGLDVSMVGDCLAPRTALEAVYEGHAAARAL